MLSRVLIVILVLVGWTEVNSHEVVPSGKDKQGAMARLEESQNHTQQQPLTCHQCHSFTSGSRCVHLAANSTAFASSCQKNQTSCMVKRFSYTENATSLQSTWSVERNCTAKCDPGCLILGERTKLYVCTSCCNHSSCNTGNKANHHHHGSQIHLLSLPLIAILLAFTRSSDRASIKQ